MNVLGETPTLEDIEDAAIILDTDKSGTVKKDQFLDWCVQYRRIMPKKSPGNETEALSPGSERRQRLIDARHERKMTERDASLLRNRIQLLEREEKRTLRRIAEANRQAAMIYDRKKNANSKYLEKHNFRSNRENELEKCKQRNNDRKQVSRAAKLKAASDLLQSRVRSANEVKSQRRQLELAKREMESDFQRKARHSHLSVVRQRSKIREKLLARKQEKQRKGQLSYRSKLVDEHVLRRMKQGHLSSLERKEEALIGRVENARMMQSEALEDLCKAVCTSPEDLGEPSDAIGS